MSAFDRKTLQSIVLEGHATHRTSLVLYASAAALLIGGLACAAAGGSVVCAGVLSASIAAFVAGGWLNTRSGTAHRPTPKTIFIAPENRGPAPPSAEPAGIIEPEQ